MSFKNARLLSKSPKDSTFSMVLRLLIVLGVLQFIAAAVVLAPRFVSTIAGQLAASKARSHEVTPEMTGPNGMMMPQSHDKESGPMPLKSAKDTTALEPSFSSHQEATSMQTKDVASKMISSGQEGVLQPGASLGIISIQHSSNTEGEQTLKIAIKARFHEVISVPDVKVQVYFYDQLNGEIVASKSPVASKWLSPPVDWKDAEPELLEVTYQPDNNNPDAHYLGYVVAIYYKGELQGYRADPPNITTQFPIKVYVGHDEI